MTVLHHTLSATCPPDTLWRELSDLAAVSKYNPTVRRSRIIGTTQRGIGAMRECELAPKGTIVERVTHWDEGRSLGFE